MFADPILSHQRINRSGASTMPQDTAPRLSHVGLYVHDVPKMIDFYFERARLCRQRRRRGRPHHLPLAQPQRPSSGRAGARPHHRCRGADGAAGVVQCRHPGAGAKGVPQNARGRVRRHQPDLPRQCLVGLFPGSRRQSASRCSATRRGMSRNPWASRSISTRPRTNSSARPRPIAGTGEGFKPIEEWRAEISKKIAAKLEA